MGNDLSRLSLEEFRDELNESLHDDELFRDFTDEIVIHRTRGELISISAHVSSQLDARADEDDEMWRRRARSFQRRVNSRISQVNGLIRQYNMTRTAEVTERKWSALALALAAALSQSDMAYMLDVIQTGDISARQWYEARSDIEAGRAVRSIDSLITGTDS